MDHCLGDNNSEAPVQAWACLRAVNWARGRRWKRIPGGGQASCFPFLVVFFVGKQSNQVLLKNKERGQPVVIGLVTVDPVIRRSGGVIGGRDDEGGGFGVLVVIVVDDVGVEGLVIRGNGVENSSDGTNEVEIDDETPGNAFCVEGCWGMQQLKF